MCHKCTDWTPSISYLYRALKNTGCSGPVLESKTDMAHNQKWNELYGKVSKLWWKYVELNDYGKPKCYLNPPPTKPVPVPKELLQEVRDFLHPMADAYGEYWGCWYQKTPIDPKLQALNENFHLGSFQEALSKLYHYHSPYGQPPG